MIQEFSEQLFKELKDGLIVTSKLSAEPLHRFREQADQIRRSISQLTSYVSDHPFADEREQISYHKVIYPRFKSQLIFYAEQYNLLSTLPIGQPGLLVAHYQEACSYHLRFISQFAFQYRYRRLLGTELDGLFFTASGDQRSALLPVLSEMDECSTAAGYLYAKFLAIEMLLEFIGQQVAKLFPAATGGKKTSGFSGFKWTGKTIDLIEVAHGLHLQDQVNNGDAGIVDFFAGLGEFFGVDLGIPKKGMDNLMERKTISRTRFTDRMRASLHEKMDELERHDPDRVLRKMRL